MIYLSLTFSKSIKKKTFARTFVLLYNSTKLNGTSAAVKARPYSNFFFRNAIRTFSSEKKIDFNATRVGALSSRASKPLHESTSAPKSRGAVRSTVKTGHKSGRFEKNNNSRERLRAIISTSAPSNANKKKPASPAARTLDHKNSARLKRAVKKGPQIDKKLSLNKQRRRPLQVSKSSLSRSPAVKLAAAQLKKFITKIGPDGEELEDSLMTPRNINPRWPIYLQLLRKTRSPCFLFFRVKAKKGVNRKFKRAPLRCDKWRFSDLKKIKKFLLRRKSTSWKGLRWRAFNKIRRLEYTTSFEYQRLKSVCYGDRYALFFEKFAVLFPFYNDTLMEEKYGDFVSIISSFAFSSYVLDWGWEASLRRKYLLRKSRSKLLKKRALSAVIPGVKKEKVLLKAPLDSLVRPISITPNRVLKRSKAAREFSWRYGKTADEKYIDVSFGQDIIDSKKRRFHMFKYNPVSQKSIDLNANKYFFHNMKRDPIYNSFLLEKVISAFAKHGRRSKIRNIFYRIFLTDKHDYSISTLYSVIGALRPTYINVPVRMAARYYYAPIKASPMRSTMRAIRFFKMAVMSNTHEKSLEEKILCELEYTFGFWGYVNPYYHDYITLSENSKYLAHFRKRRVI